MEDNYGKTIAFTAVAPIVWGSAYYVTRNFLPPDYPVTGAVMRALPAGLMLLLFTRKLPAGVWWIKTALISTLTVSGFFVLIYVAGSRLPSSVASMIMALSPFFTMVLAWLVLKEAITYRKLWGGLLGIFGVYLLMGAIQESLDLWGVAASFAGMMSSASGFVLTRKWSPPVSPAAFAAWQLSLGGVILLPIAWFVEGVMPPPSISAIWGYTYLILIASVIAYVCWFVGVLALPAGTVSIIGLLNPLSGVMCGVLLAHETLSAVQILGCLLILGGTCIGVVGKGNLREIKKLT